MDGRPAVTRLPLEGVRVFDLTLFMAGPWASMQLGAFGADVIHVMEPNLAWDSVAGGARPTINGTSIGYVSWNLNKRGLTLDLKSEEGRRDAHELLKTCDVFLMNMRTGVAERLGVDYETVSKIRPDIIYCAITGWGETGPMSHEPGGDTPIYYGSGFATGTGTPDGEDEINRHFSQMDGTSGNYAAQAILMALLARRKTGRGQRIHLSMLRASMALQTVRIGEYLTGGYQARRLGSQAQSTAPDRAFLCENQRYIGVAVTSEPEWRAFCEAIGEAALATDTRFATNSARVANREALDAILEPVFLSKPVDFWRLRLGRTGVITGYPMSWAELRYHQQVHANHYMNDVDTPAWGVLTSGGPPWHFEKTGVRWTASPLPGQDNDEILGELREGRGRPAEAAREA
jgi:crotonobetainyl-CoA:carnitine CoA-transferase CaiB-like acyl-CoA transferase